MDFRHCAKAVGLTKEDASQSHFDASVFDVSLFFFYEECDGSDSNQDWDHKQGEVKLRGKTFEELVHQNQNMVLRRAVRHKFSTALQRNGAGTKTGAPFRSSCTCSHSQCPCPGPNTSERDFNQTR